jgi:RimJ/RimL family protein N-acetyltransferase
MPAQAHQISLTIPVLVTDRLRLRGPKDSDAAPLATFLASDRAKWIGGPYPAEDAADWLAHQTAIWAKRGWGSWIAALRDDDTPIGRIGLLDHEGWDEPELAWFLFEGFDGKGYAYEAATAARAHANGPLDLPPLFSFIEPTNARSKALVLRMGAQLERSVRFKDHDLGIYRHPGAEARA